MAADLALQGASVHPDAAQDALRAALAGAREAVKPDSAVLSDRLDEEGNNILDVADMLLPIARIHKQDVSCPGDSVLHSGLSGQ